MNADPKIIIPLDFPDARQALALAVRMDPALCRMKVGKELFTRSGPSVVESLIKLGYSVFLDLKFHDIPNTVASACAAAADLGVWMINVHASGGEKMMSMARETLDKKSQRPLLVAVTVLTSMSDADLKQTGVNKPVMQQVVDLAKLTQTCGLDGIVCSAQEVKTLRSEIKGKFTLVTPGIRPAGSDKNDQSRVMTPAEAIRAGSDYLVIGRPITQATDPLAVLMAIDEEIKNVKREA